ncbi:MAG: hypothetical protein H6739_07840 [Alphaproteobacteria bacterium]|nr:hypothetical protein [Alphaproteobacteria bacterium]
MNSYCLRCGRARLPREWSCPCGGSVYGDALRNQEGAQAPSVLRGLLGQVTLLPPGGVMLLYGPRGSGKSTVALQGFERPAVVTTEMGADLVLAYAKRLGVSCAIAAEPAFDEEAGWRWPHGWADADGVVVDSVTVGEPLALFEAAAAWGRAAGLAVICVSQVTVKGEARGGSQLAHKADVVVRLVPDAGARELVVEKSRFGPQGSMRFRLGDDGPHRAGAFYFTVTGDYPAYRLDPYPWTGSEVWEAVERGELDRAPDPPVACAARRSALYGGWVEPPDIEDRRAFAERHGVTFWRLA